MSKVIHLHRGFFKCQQISQLAESMWLKFFTCSERLPQTQPFFLFVESMWLLQEILDPCSPLFDLHLFWPVVDLLPQTLGYVLIFRKHVIFTEILVDLSLNCSWIAISDTLGHFPICRKHVTVAGKFLALAHRPQVASDPSIHSLSLSSQNTKSVVAGPLCFPDNTRLCIFLFKNTKSCWDLWNSGSLNLNIFY